MNPKYLINKLYYKTSLLSMNLWNFYRKKKEKIVSVQKYAIIPAPMPISLADRIMIFRKLIIVMIRQVHDKSDRNAAGNRYRAPKNRAYHR